MDQEIGHVRVGDERRSGLGDCDDRIASCDSGQPLFCKPMMPCSVWILQFSQEGGRDRRRRHDRFGQGGTADLDEDPHRVDVVHPEATELFRNEQSGDSDLAMLGPEFGGAAGFGLPLGPNELDRTFTREKVANGFLKQELVFVEVEFHRSLYFRGMPRIRSAMMLRWISFVPA